MKTAFLAAVSLSLLAANGALAQAPSRQAQTRARLQTGNFAAAPRNADGNFTAQTPRADGAVPRVVRSGNPLQMINPFAPAEYGSGQEVTRREDADPYQNMRGIKLVSVEF